MGEALIVSRGAGSSGSSGKTLISQIFIENTIWKAPKIPDQNFSVRIFGGGGAGLYIRDGGNSYGGGGGGWMNNAILKINAGEEIQITIGRGGLNNSVSRNGEMSAFGTYLSAQGGTTAVYDYAQISNSYRVHYSYGGYGGSGGGAGGSGETLIRQDNNFNYANIPNYFKYASTGFQFGGGGGYYGGNGGKWGGGGGSIYGINNNSIKYGGCLYENSQNMYEVTGFSGLAGNGGNNKINAENGTNTIGMGLEFEGAGLKSCIDAQSSNINAIISGSAGGGYGGNGSVIFSNSSQSYYISPCAGGGYGSNGGNIYSNNSCHPGGGGYGADGGGSYINSAGGGGGYGRMGKGGGVYLSNPYDSSNTRINSVDGGIAAGGGAVYQQNGSGGNGICIIQYYI